MNPNTHPLAQEFSVALQVPDHTRFFFHDPNLGRLDDGTLLIAAPQWPRKREQPDYSLRIARSADGGKTWEELLSLPYQEGIPFVLGGQLLMFVQETSHRDVQIVASDDGETWTDPVTVIEGPLWNISTARLVRRDTVYWAMDYDLPSRMYSGKVMVRLDRAKSPLDPQAWSVSDIVQPPELPELLTRNLYPHGDTPDLTTSWSNKLVLLEPNTVEVNGRVRVFTRAIIDEYASAHMAAVYDYDEGAGELSFTQLASWPGGQCKFFVVPDYEHSMYWMLSNLVTNSQDLLGWGQRMRETGYHGGPGNERRWLFLHYSIDCLNWFPAGCVARWPDQPRNSFMYPSAVVDGDDLMILSRTSRDSGDQHDADLCTIHRVEAFRDLAMDLHAGGLHEHG